MPSIYDPGGGSGCIVVCGVFGIVINLLRATGRKIIRKK